MQITNPAGGQHIRAENKQALPPLKVGLAADGHRVTIHADYRRMTMRTNELRALIDGLHDRLDELEATWPNTISTQTR